MTLWKVENLIRVSLRAIRTVLSALSGLRPEARSRVVDYVFKRLGLMSESMPFSSAPTSGLTSPLTFSLPLSSSTQAGKDIRSLTAEKQPRSANEMAALVAFYLSEEAPVQERKDEIGVEEIKKYFKQALFRLPKNSSMALINAKNAGYLDCSAPGLYKLNPVGYNLVVHRLPVKGAQKPVKRNKAKKAKRPRPPKKSVK